MMRVCERLVNANSNLILNNHKVNFIDEGREFMFYSIVICRTNDKAKTFKVDEELGTFGIIRAINNYREYFTSIGYKEI